MGQARAISRKRLMKATRKSAKGKEISHELVLSFLVADAINNAMSDVKKKRRLVFRFLSGGTSSLGLFFMDFMFIFILSDLLIL
jgi:hypothetical protein